MAQDKASLDIQVATVGGSITDLINALGDLVTKMTAGFANLEKKIADGAKAVDLQVEVDQLKAVNSAIQGAITTVQAAAATAQTEAGK